MNEYKQILMMGPPNQIYVIRHADKQIDLAIPEPPFGVEYNGTDSIHSLIPRGWQRAGALITLFDPTDGLLQYGLKRPLTLFSPLFGTIQNTMIQRTYQTIQGLAGRVNTTINNVLSVGQEPELVDLILNSCSDVVLVSWEHHHIPRIAFNMPVIPGTYIPSVWPDDRFDVIWSFTLVPNSNPIQYTFSQVPQRLLPGDPDMVIS